jgi:hypothetical protein
MPNTLLTPQIIAMEALAILRNQFVFKDLVHTDYSNEFVKVGDTITVRKPATLIAKDFAGSISTQDLTEQGISVQLNRFKDVSVAITSKQQSLELKDFAKQVIEPAMVALAQQIDEDIANFAFEKAGFTVEASTATPTTLADIANAGKILDIQKAPLIERAIVLHPQHKYRYALTPNLSQVNFAGDNQTLRDALLGKIYNMNSYMGQNLPASTAAVSGTAIKTFKVATGTTAGQVAITELSAATATVKIGDGFVYLGKLYRFTADGTGVSSGITSIAVSPAFPAGVTTPVTVRVVRFASSIAMHKNAFAFVMRPLDLPMGAARAAVVNGEGLAVRVVYGYDQASKIDTVSFDVLYGVAALHPENAVVLIDTY